MRSTRTPSSTQPHRLAKGRRFPAGSTCLPNIHQSLRTRPGADTRPLAPRPRESTLRALRPAAYLRVQETDSERLARDTCGVSGGGQVATGAGRAVKQKWGAAELRTRGARGSGGLR